MTSLLELAHAYHAAEETRNVEAIVGCFTEDIVWSSGEETLVGQTAIVDAYGQMAQDFPGLRVTITGHAGTDEQLAVNWDAILTDPSGKRFRLSGVNVFRRRGDKISHLTSFGGELERYESDAIPRLRHDRFRGWKVLVTGAAHGIGAAVSQRFVGEGASVFGIDLDDAALRDLRAATEGFDGTFTGVTGDITDPGVISHALDLAASSDGRIDTLVNNAAVFHLGAIDATAWDWDRTLAVNVVAPARLTAAAVPALERSPHASVINVASVSGHVAQAGRWTYGAGKGATLSLTRSQALDLAPHCIRVNSVSPGYIWTEVLERSAGGDRETWEKIWGEFCMLGRCGEPSEVAAAIAYLASDDASFITGTDLLIDGGLASMSPDGRSNFEFSS